MLANYAIITPPDLPPLRVCCAQGRVQSVEWITGKAARNATPEIHGSGAELRLLKRVVRDLDKYFNGETPTFNWPFDWSQGTPFQQKVWRALQAVPYGETRSYQWIANKIRNPAAVRAVGQANGKNPFSLVVPCHRIIQKDGSIGGYTGGLAIKRKLLAIEQHD